MGILSILWFKLLLLYKTYHLLLEFSLSLYINLNDTNHSFIFYNFNTIKSNHYRRCYSIPNTGGSEKCSDVTDGSDATFTTGGSDVDEGSDVTFTTGGSDVLALDIEGGSDINTSVDIEVPPDIGPPDIGLDCEIDGMMKDPYKGIDRELFNLNNDFHNCLNAINKKDLINLYKLFINYVDKFSKITKPLYHKPIKYHEEIINPNTHTNNLPQFTNIHTHNTNNNNTIHEDTYTTPLEVQSTPPEVQSTSLPLAVVASSNYLSLKGNATPGDRGGRERVLDATSSGLPVADLREAEGELNKEAAMAVGREVGDEVSDVTSSGKDGVMGYSGDKKPQNVELPHDSDILPHNSPLEVTPTVGPADSSFNYLSLMGKTTPRDRGDNSSEQYRTSSGSGLPGSDLRELEGEVNREATTASGNDRTKNDISMNGILLPIRPCRYKSNISYDYISDEMIDGMMKRYRWHMEMKDDIDDGLISLVMNHRIRFSYIMGMMMKLVYNNNDINIINNIIKRLSKLDVPITYTLYEGYALLYLKTNRIDLSLNMIENIIKIGYISKHKYYESLFIYLEEQLDINNLLLLLKHSIYKSKLKFTGFWFIRILLVILYSTQNKLYNNQINIINILYNMKSNIITLLNLYLSYHINTFSISTRLAFILQYLYNLFIPNLITLTNVAPTHEVQSNSTEVTTTVPLSVEPSPPEVTTTVPLAVEASSNYISLKSIATPRDRGSEDGSYWTSSGSGKPAADLREAKGEVNRRSHHGEWKGDENEGFYRTSSGESGVIGGYGDNKHYNNNLPHDIDKKHHNVELPDNMPHNSSTDKNNIDSEEQTSNVVDVTSGGLPVADLREAEGEVNKEAVCKTTSGGGHHGEWNIGGLDHEWTAPCIGKDNMTVSSGITSLGTMEVGGLRYTMDDSIGMGGICDGCNGSIPLYYLSDDDKFKLFSNWLLSLYMNNPLEIINLSSLYMKLFNAFMDGKPYTAILDGQNIGYSNNFNKIYDINYINLIKNKLEQRGERVLIILPKLLSGYYSIITKDVLKFYFNNINNNIYEVKYHNNGVIPNKYMGIINEWINNDILYMCNRYGYDDNHILFCGIITFNNNEYNYFVKYLINSLNILNDVLIFKNYNKFNFIPHKKTINLHHKYHPIIITKDKLYNLNIPNINNNLLTTWKNETLYTFNNLIIGNRLKYTFNIYNNNNNIWHLPLGYERNNNDYMKRYKFYNTNEKIIPSLSQPYIEDNGACGGDNNIINNWINKHGYQNILKNINKENIIKDLNFQFNTENPEINKLKFNQTQTSKWICINLNKINELINNITHN